MEVRLSDPRPCCVYADDAPLAELGTAELLVVASIRVPLRHASAAAQADYADRGLALVQ